MKVLIIGFGSIGARHARILQGLGCTVSVVSEHGTQEYPCFSDLKVAITKVFPDYVVIATKTFQHYDILRTLTKLEFAGKVLVEKPLFHKALPIPQYSFKDVFVAYNLRFHPLLQKLKFLLQNQVIVSVNAYVGQYLPDWRPQSDYRSSYSVNAVEGGGVLRDLSHEFDYLNWLFGDWQSVVASGGHYSHLFGDSEDVCGLLIKMKQCPVTVVHLTYLDRFLRREVVINTDTNTYILDLAHNSLRINDQTEIFPLSRDDTYRAEHLAVMNSDYSALCSLEQGIDIVDLIDSAEISMIEQRWVKK